MRLFLFSALLIVSLTSCRLWDPTFMPAGYSFHHETYKSPPGPKAPDIGYEYSADKNEEMLNEWRYAVRDLLLKARAQGITLPETLMLTTDLDQNAFQSSYDFILREGLREYGHVLSNNPQSATLFYSAYDPETGDQYTPTSDRPYNGTMPSDDEEFKTFGPTAQKMKLVIGIIDNKILTQETHGLYELPLYGYAPGDYVTGHKNPLKQKETLPHPLFKANTHATTYKLQE